VADLPNRSDIFSVGRAFVRSAPNIRVSPEVVDVDGSDLNLLIGAGSLMGEAIVAAMANCLRGAFVDAAVDAQLDRVVADRFNMTRKSAQPALVDLVFTRPTDGAGAGTIPAGTTVSTAAGTTFTTDVDVSYGPTDLTVDVGGTCSTAGPQGNVPGGAAGVTSISDAVFDSTIVVSNPNPAAGGANQETNAQLRARARSFFATIRRGVLGAMVTAAQSVATVAVANAFEVVNPDGLPAAAVQLVIADANGNFTSGMVQQVINVLLEYRAAGIPVFVTGGTVVFEQVVWSGLEYADNVNTQQAQANVMAVSAAITQFLAPGAKLQRSVLFAAAQTVPGVIVPDTSLLAPAGDILPATNSTLLRVRPQDVSFQ
jgi:uncharacterized phage protein gp47/JayE